MAVRVIQTFVSTCADCPNCSYYSGGVYECTLTDERIFPADREYKIASRCPLPFAGSVHPTPTPSEAPEMERKTV